MQEIIKMHACMHAGSDGFNYSMQGNRMPVPMYNSYASKLNICLLCHTGIERELITGTEQFALTKTEYLPQADTESPPVGSGQEGSKNLQVLY